MKFKYAVQICKESGDELDEAFGYEFPEGFREWKDSDEREYPNAKRGVDWPRGRMVVCVKTENVYVVDAGELRNARRAGKSRPAR